MLAVYMYLEKRETSGWRNTGSGRPIATAASANQNVSNNIRRDKPEEWLPCLSHELKHSTRAIRLVDSEQGFKIRRPDGARSWTTRDVSAAIQ